MKKFLITSTRSEKALFAAINCFPTVAVTFQPQSLAFIFDFVQPVGAVGDAGRFGLDEFEFTNTECAGAKSIRAMVRTLHRSSATLLSLETEV